MPKFKVFVNGRNYWVNLVAMGRRFCDRAWKKVCPAG